MTNDEILQAAKDAGFCESSGTIPSFDLFTERFAAIIEKLTIERCAVEAYKAYATDEVIAAIRKLGEQE